MVENGAHQLFSVCAIGICCSAFAGREPASVIVWLRGSAEVSDSPQGSECSEAGALVGRQDRLARLRNGAPYRTPGKSGSGEAADARRG